MRHFFTMLRRKIFGMTCFEKACAALIAGDVAISLYEGPIGDFDPERDIAWGTKTLDPEQATRIVG